MTREETDKQLDLMIEELDAMGNDSATKSVLCKDCKHYRRAGGSDECRSPKTTRRSVVEGSTIYESCSFVRCLSGTECRHFEQREERSFWQWAFGWLFR